MAPLASPVAHPPIDPLIVQQAARWMARMWSGEVSEEDRLACQAWRAENPEHERAWQRLQSMDTQLAIVPRAVAHHALVEPVLAANASRRKAMRALGIILGVGVGAYTTSQTHVWQMVSSDIHTDTGEVRTITLADGTQVVLNTATAIDVRFDDHARRIVLRQGEILVTTAVDTAPVKRPLSVETRHGEVLALGTRFATRDEGHSVNVAVFEGAVSVSPRNAKAFNVRVDAGFQTMFSAEQANTPIAAQVRDLAWEKGVLVAEDMRVDTFVATLSRYRVGIVRCDPDIAHLQLTGVYSLKDTDRALDNLTLALPVEIVYRTRYWVSVRAKRVS